MRVQPLSRDDEVDGSIPSKERVGIDAPILPSSSAEPLLLALSSEATNNFCNSVQLRRRNVGTGMNLCMTAMKLEEASFLTMAMAPGGSKEERRKRRGSSLENWTENNDKDARGACNNFMG